MEQAVKNFWRRRRKRAVALTNCHTELFFRTKKLDKTELRATVAEYIKKTYSRRQDSQRQFVDSYSKLNGKYRKKETKILTQFYQSNKRLL